MFNKIFLFFIFTFLSTSISFAKTSFKRDEIIFPKGRSEIERFLDLLKDSENKKTVGIEATKVSYHDIPEEGSAIFTINSSDYMLYLDDFSNSGKKVYFIIYINSGSGNYSGVQGAYLLEGTRLTSLKFDDIVVKNLFPKGDLSQFHERLAKPFVVKSNGKIILRFFDGPSSKVHSYRWEKDKFQKVEI